MSQAEYSWFVSQTYSTILAAHKVALKLSNATGIIHMAFNLNGINAVSAVRS